MAEGSDEIRVPFLVQIRLPPRHRPGMPHRRRMVNHPAHGWQAGKAPASAGPPSPALPVPAEGAAPNSAPDEKASRTDAARGFIVVLPDGSTVADALSPTGKLMAPVSDLRPVAAAGRRAKLSFEVMLENPETAGGAFWGLASELGANLGHAGRFDFQRDGDFFAGYKHFNQFVEVSSFNVGLFCQQAGLTLEQTFKVAGAYASLKSSNYTPSQPYGLPATGFKFINLGHKAGQSGVYDED